MKTYKNALAVVATSISLTACGGTNVFNKGYTGTLGVIHLIAIVWAVVDIVGSTKKSTGTKVLWIFVVAIAPVFGLIFYILAGREK